ncbi:MAG: response regulator transcription factor, partial [Atopobiaceae bacterium]|nr:response regulator transcription factor [Atopobiaceae bacterium]
MTRILVVEDEPKIARFVELELTHEGYEVDKVDNGRDAVEAALGNDYDLVLLDILLPQLNGMEVLRRIRKEKDVPVILLTARDAVMDKVAGLDAGADDYITKPFAIEELLARIRVALKRREAAGTPQASDSQAPVEPDRHVLSA